MSTYPPWPFFVGSGRSGTTLIRAMFDSHPEMAVAPVSDFLVPIGRGRSRYETGGGLDSEKLVADLFAFERFRRWGLDRDMVITRLTSEDVTTTPDALRSLFQLYAQTQGKPRYGDKTASYVLHQPLLAEMFPEARFVHMIRDGRDVALSYMESKAKKWGPHNLPVATMRWKVRIEEGRRTGTALGSHRYTEVRYEDLVTDPEKVLRALCGFIDLPFDDSMLRYFERASEIVGPLTNPTANRRIFEPLQSKTRDWRDSMSPSDLAFFEAVAARSLDRFGYERSLDRIPLRARVRAAWGLADMRARRLVHGLRSARRVSG